jgi:N-acetylmuramic acid 6-phosphate etherase
VARTRYERLPTEQANAASAALDRMTPLAIARLMNREDARAVRAVGRVLPEVAAAVDVIAGALARGGRLLFVGAGTSGRLGVLEAAECPPTFGTPRTLVQAIIAGGRGAVFRSREGAEDDARAAERAVRARVRPGDVVVGVSASGVTPFVRAGLAAGRGAGAATVLVACNPAAGRSAGGRAPGARAPRAAADLLITPAPGPEVLAGSTRLKAGTATKLVLNMLTTATMVRLGRVYGNRMIDVQPRSLKLRERAIRLVRDLADVSPAAARRAFEASGRQVRVAVVVARTGASPAQARQALARVGGALRSVLDVAVSRGHETEARGPLRQARQSPRRRRPKSRPRAGT